VPALVLSQHLPLQRKLFADRVYVVSNISAIGNPTPCECELTASGVQMDQVMEENSQLRSQVEGNLQQRNQLANELGDMRGKFQTMAANNVNMDAKVQALRQSLQVPPPPPFHPCLIFLAFPMSL